jgi:sugar phosphate isomerase/epimerase
MKSDRRKAIKQITLSAAAAPIALAIPSIFTSCGNSSENKSGSSVEATNELFFSISLAQWSLNRSIFGKSRENLNWEEFGKILMEDPDRLYQGSIDPMDFPVVARQQFGIEAIELVNTFYFSKAEDAAYLSEFKNKCDGEGVSVQLIMCDALGNLGDLDEASRIKTVENHYKWVDAAKFLGCHSIRVNAAGNGTADEVKSAAIDGLGRLTVYGQQAGINIIVENHGGYSSDGNWLSGVISEVNSDFCGTLPDFGNFCMEYGDGECAKEYDKYKGVSQLMPFAKGVSAKTYGFDDAGNETKIDYARMLKIVKDAGFKGHIGIEFEGDGISEEEGIKATKQLLLRLGSVI